MSGCMACRKSGARGNPAFRNWDGKKVSTVRIHTGARFFNRGLVTNVCVCVWGGVCGCVCVCFGVWVCVLVCGCVCWCVGGWRLLTLLLSLLLGPGELRGQNVAGLPVSGRGKGQGSTGPARENKWRSLPAPGRLEDMVVVD